MQTRRHKKHQKLYNMKGCSKRKSSSSSSSSSSRRRRRGHAQRKTRSSSIGGDASIAPYRMGQQGGSHCPTCSSTGSSPASFVGQAWSIDNTGGNHLAQNLYKTDVQTAMQLNGGKKGKGKGKSKKNKSKKRNISGGGLWGELVNFNRDIMYNANTAYSTIKGHEPAASPAPYEGQLTKSISASRIII